MAMYIVSGSSSGIGLALCQQLVEAGHQVLGIDLQGADFNVDLSVTENIAPLAEALIEHLDSEGQALAGFIPCAGVGPHTQPLSIVPKINYFACVRLIEAMLPVIERDQAVVALVASNSASMAGLNQAYIEALLAMDETKACEIISALDGHNAYAGSKQALIRWMRAHSTAMAKKGVRINAIAPGITQTAMTDAIMDDGQFGGAMKAFGESVPLGKLANPEQIADVICFMLSEAASFMTGSVLFVDGGHDAMLRPDQF